MISSMSREEILGEIERAISDLDADACKKACQRALKERIAPMDIITEGMAKGMETVGRKFECREIFLSDLIMAGEVMREAMDIVKPNVKQDDVRSTGNVALGVVRGDLHDIGKNIVVMLLQAAGFEVADLGIDVTAEKFVEAVQKNAAEIVGISALLTVTMPEIESVINELEKAGLRKGVRVVIGGAAITPEYGERIGADYAAKDAVDGVNECKAWAAAKR